MRKLAPAGFEDIRWLGEHEIGITAEIAFARCSATESPSGLGEWLQQRPDLDAHFHASPGDWDPGPRPVGRELVLKVAKLDPIMQGQLINERAALMQLSKEFREESEARPCLLFGYGMVGGSPYLVLEAIERPDGGKHGFVPLDEYQRRYGSLTELQAMRCIYQLCRVIHSCHEASVVHNDINAEKLGQIFWDPVEARLRLIDFGMAGVMASADNSAPGLSFAQDREGIGRVLFRLLTGVSTSPGTQVTWPTPPRSSIASFVQKCTVHHPQAYQQLKLADSQRMEDDAREVWEQLEAELQEYRRQLTEAISANHKADVARLHAAISALDPSDPTLPSTGPLEAARERLQAVKRELDNYRDLFVVLGMPGIEENIDRARVALREAWDLRESVTFDRPGVTWLCNELADEFPGFPIVDRYRADAYLEILQAASKEMHTARLPEGLKQDAERLRDQLLMADWPRVIPRLFSVSEVDASAEFAEMRNSMLAYCGKVALGGGLSNLAQWLRDKEHEAPRGERRSRLVKLVDDLEESIAERLAFLAPQQGNNKSSEAGYGLNSVPELKALYARLADIATEIERSEDAVPEYMPVLRHQLQGNHSVAGALDQQRGTSLYPAMINTLTELEGFDPELVLVFENLKQDAKQAAELRQRSLDLAEQIAGVLEKRSRLQDDPGVLAFLTRAQELSKDFKRLDKESPLSRGLQSAIGPLLVAFNGRKPRQWHPLHCGWLVVAALEATLTEATKFDPEAFSPFFSEWQRCEGFFGESPSARAWGSGDENLFVLPDIRALASTSPELITYVEPLYLSLALTVATAVAMRDKWRTAEGLAREAAGIASSPEAGVPLRQLADACSAVQSGLEAWRNLEFERAMASLNASLSTLRTLDRHFRPEATSQQPLPVLPEPGFGRFYDAR